MNIQSDRYKVFLLTFFIAVSAILLVIFGKDTQSAVLLSGIIGLILLIGKPLWFSNRHSDTAVKLYSLFVASSAVFAFVGWKAFLEDFLKAVLKDNYPSWSSQNPELMAGMVFAFLAFVIYVINRKVQPDSTGMGIHPNSIDSDIPEPSFQDRLHSVCEALTDDLKIIDNKTNWSTHLFTPLDAEVEVNTRNGKDRKITDLLKAIKRSNKRLFLVLGSPGAGKSVALRKLCQELAAEVKSTGKIPIYVNLREWQSEVVWSENSPPTVDQLAKFVKQNVMNRDIVTTKFFDRYFDRLYETGRLYFVFDSFDEIPQVLNEKENSELIHQLSEVVFKFLKGARQESQGILSSRMFRKPTIEFQSEVTLEIRPFTEEKIIQTFKNTGSFDEKIISKLFRTRPELVPIARNPFSAVLISEYTDKNGGNLPPNQSEMYASYIEQTLDSCSNRIYKKGLSKADIIDHTIKIANTMFNSHGLEAPVTKLAEELPDIPVEDVIDVLKFARLGRAGSGDDNVFSFSHRRFTEYFTISKIIRNDETVSLDAIPKDSQWRDALVLYCEVVEQKKATEVAEFCWKIILTKDNLQDQEVVHCLRFLRDAFRGRPECILSFRDDLGCYLERQIKKENDVLSIQLVIDILPLLSQENVDASISKALFLENSIIDDASINIYRSMPSVSKPLLKAVTSTVRNKDILEVLRDRKKLLFSFSLSKAFKSVRRDLKVRIFCFYISLLLGLLAFIYLPILSLFCFILSFVTVYFEDLVGSFSKSSNTHENLSRILYGYLISLLIILMITSAFMSMPDPSDRIKPNVMDRSAEIEEMCRNIKCYRSKDYFDIPSLFGVNDRDNSFKSESEPLNEIPLSDVFDNAVYKMSHEYSLEDKKVLLIYDIKKLIEKEYFYIIKNYGLTLLFSLLAMLIVLKGKKGGVFFDFNSLFRILKVSSRSFLIIFAFFLIIYIIIRYVDLELFIAKYQLFFTIFVFLLFCFSLVSMLFTMLSSLFYYFNDIFIIRKIRYESLNSKDIIYEYFSSTKFREKVRLVVVSYLEKNIKSPKGEWPDLSIFTADKTTSSFIRLARLEQKWREAG